ncbi:ATP synthase E chain-domain-containing protein [Myxozyma melibiosi]|uniref:ATP synthase F(0) complex subunit e, mitochondrial n=1 Tax=Myxozyma melibiosi TaxID=54550 RepID=A0ABR1F5A1_9ASCO
MRMWAVSGNWVLPVFDDDDDEEESATMSTNTTPQVFRWTALGAGVIYGAAHSFSITSARKAKHAADEWAHKEALIAQAKAEYAKLHPKPVAAAGATLDLSDPNFDYAKFLESALAE